jgi:predicted HAD superfamily Cof-like phosphohydrolase
MSDQLKDVLQFHDKFGMRYDGPPRLPDHDLKMFRLRFLAEELTELAGALGVTAKIEFTDDVNLSTVPEHEAVKRKKDALDGLIDLDYVVKGTAVLLGFATSIRVDTRDGQPGVQRRRYDVAWSRVHAANMRKERGTSPARGFTDDRWDVRKPPGWEAANLTDLVT